MERRLLGKDLVFFNPGKTGVVFTYGANRYITPEQLLKAQEFLVQETRDPVIYIEDRRVRPRSE